jgi:hypothetical protein
MRGAKVWFSYGVISILNEDGAARSKIKASANRKKSKGLSEPPEPRNSADLR